MEKLPEDDLQTALQTAADIVHAATEPDDRAGDDGSLLVELGETYRALGREEDAKRAFSDVVARVRSYADIFHSPTIPSLFANGADTEAYALIQKWRQFAESLPTRERSRVYSHLVSSLERSSRNDEAAQLIRDTEESSHLPYRLVSHWIQAGEFEKAIATISEMNDADERIVAWLSIAYRKANEDRPEEARAALREVSAIHTATDAERRSDMYFAQMNQFADVVAAMGDLEEALDIADRCQLRPIDIHMVKRQALEHFWRVGRFSDALSLIAQIVADEGVHERRDFMYRLWTAAAYGRAGRNSEALDLLTLLWEEVRGKPENFGDVCSIAITMTEAGFLDNAQSALAEAYRCSVPSIRQREWAHQMLGVIKAQARAGLVLTQSQRTSCRSQRQ